MITVLLSSSILILFSAKIIELDETSINCNPVESIILKEKFNIFTGYSKERICKWLYENDGEYMDIPVKLFEEPDIIRFTVIGLNKKPFIYKSRFFINNIPCDSHDLKTILKFYINVLYLMNEDESFNKNFKETCLSVINSKIAWDSRDFGRMEFITMTLYDIFYLKIDSKGSEFDLFKSICVTLLKKVNSDIDLKEELEQFSKKQKNEIYNLSRKMIDAILNVNFYLNHAAIIKSSDNKERLKNFIKE